MSFRCGGFTDFLADKVKIGFLKDIAVGHDAGTFDEVLQLPHIARPAVGRQIADRSVGNSFVMKMILAVNLLDD